MMYQLFLLQNRLCTVPMGRYIGIIVKEEYASTFIDAVKSALRVGRNDQRRREMGLSFHAFIGASRLGIMIP